MQKYHGLFLIGRKQSTHRLCNLLKFAQMMWIKKVLMQLEMGCSALTGPHRIPRQGLSLGALVFGNEVGALGRAVELDGIMSMRPSCWDYQRALSLLPLVHAEKRSGTTQREASGWNAPCWHLELDPVPPEPRARRGALLSGEAVYLWTGHLALPSASWEAEAARSALTSYHVGRRRGLHGWSSYQRHCSRWRQGGAGPGWDGTGGNFAPIVEGTCVEKPARQFLGSLSHRSCSGHQEPVLCTPAGSW